MTMNNQSFIGKGWGFPVLFSNNGGEIIMSEGQMNIDQSLDIILSTETAERFIQPYFGCSLQRFIYENYDTLLITQLKDMISNAILMYEPRIDLMNIEINKDPNSFNVVLISMEYRIRSTNTRENKVYPFYLTEANI